MVLGLSFGICVAQEKPNYIATVEQIQKQRKVFRKAYEAFPSKSDSVINVARQYLINTMDAKIFPSWYGTPWDFNGTVRLPQKGSIACGYFVTNTLIDLGLKIPRYKWAQSASETFIKKLSSKDIKRYSNEPIEKVKKDLLIKGNGLYLIGLDFHVGYVIVSGNCIRFIHSNFEQPDIGVMWENFGDSSAILNSSYRVVGKLFSKEMMVNWIMGHPYN
jgi:hypothetical protein